MGAVYLAKQISLDREVAVKILPRELSADPEFRSSFQTEARAMARLNHPNLIGIYDSGDVDGMLYIAMEYVPGKSLYHSAWNKKIDPVEASRIVISICEGLSHAHENGIIHRDIKPANILLTPKAEPKIGDFGLAQAVGVKHEGIVMGTPGYAAPEVMTHPDKADRRSDIFAVGVILHELLTGQKPEAGQTASSLCGCSPDFDTVIQRATHPSPLMRYPDASSMALAIRAAAESKTRTKSPAKLAVHQPRAVSPKALLAPQTTAKAPTLLTPSEQRESHGPATSVVAASRRAKSSVTRNLIIIATLLFLLVIVYQAYEMRQSAAVEPIAQPSSTSSSSADQPEISPSRPTSPSSDDSTSPPPGSLPTRRIETPRQSLDRLKLELANGLRQEMPYGAIRRGDFDYLLVTEPMTWDAAMKFAEDHGGHVAFPFSAEDLSFLGTFLKNNETIWLGAGRRGRDDWALLNGSPWPLEKKPPGLGSYAALSHLGNVRAAESHRPLPFILAWHRDGTNPFTLIQLLEFTRESLNRAQADYPPGTQTCGNSHFLPIVRPLTRKAAQDLAERAGAQLANLSKREENYWVTDHLSQLHAPGGLWLGGQKSGGVWQWDSQEAWTYAAWAQNFPIIDEEASCLAYLPGQGWINRPPHHLADGVLLEWNAGEPRRQKASEPASSAGSDLASLVTRCRELLTNSAEERDQAMAKNVDSFLWDLDVWERNLKLVDRERWGTAVETLKSLAEEKGKIPSAAKASQVIREELQWNQRNSFRKQKDGRQDDDSEDEKPKRKLNHEGRDNDSSLLPMPSGIAKAHTFALQKQNEILEAYSTRNTKIRDAYVIKIKEMGYAAQTAGQLDLVKQLREYLEATTDLESWVETMINPS